MRRPRRPVLAAVCAVLLLATAALWVRGLYRRDALTVVIEQWVGIYPSSVPGGFSLELDDRREQYGHGSEFDTSKVPADVAPDWWFDGFKGPSNVYVFVPWWAIAPFPMFGLWWFWRGRKAGKGFPVEAKADPEQVGRISN